MRGTVEVGRFSSALLEGLSSILEDEVDALYHRLSPALKRRLQKYGEKARHGAEAGPEVEVAEGLQRGRGRGGDDE